MQQQCLTFKWSLYVFWQLTPTKLFKISNSKNDFQIEVLSLLGEWLLWRFDYNTTNKRGQQQCLNIQMISVWCFLTVHAHKIIQDFQFQQCFSNWSPSSVRWMILMKIWLIKSWRKDYLTVARFKRMLLKRTNFYPYHVHQPRRKISGKHLFVHSLYLFKKY